MTELEELAATLRALRDAFARLGVTWAVGGSLASASYGEPRATNDVDVIALLSSSDAHALTETLGPDFYASAEAAREAVERRDSFNLIDQRSFLKVDVFVPPDGPLGTGQLARRREVELLGGVTVPILGPEDVVLQKLRWYRLGGESSERQWRDLCQVLAALALDDAYLDEVAAGAELGELLSRARREEASEA